LRHEDNDDTGPLRADFSAIRSSFASIGTAELPEDVECCEDIGAERFDRLDLFDLLDLVSEKDPLPLEPFFEDCLSILSRPT